jgi:pyruvate formate lyase activating enzyme
MPWHLSRFHPDYLTTDIAPTPLSTLQMAARIGKEEGLDYVYLGNVLTDDGQNTRCPGCGTVLIGRWRYARPDVRIKEPRCPGCGRQIPVVLS